jgi:hypothetical protein
MIDDEERFSGVDDKDIKKLYDEEVALYNKLATSINKDAKSFAQIPGLFEQIIGLIQGYDNLPNALKWFSNGALTDPAKDFQKFSEACPDWVDKQDSISGSPLPGPEDVRKLALEVDGLSKIRLPFDSGASWIDWFLNAVPNCLYQGFSSLQESMLSRVLLSREHLKVVETDVNDYEGFCGMLGLKISKDEKPSRESWLKSCAAMLKSHGWLLAHVHENASVDRKENKDEDREAYQPPLSAFAKNREASARWLNRFRNVLGRSFEAKLRRKFNVLQTIWGTNIHGAAVVDPTGSNPRVEYASFRIADFAVCSKTWRSCEIGVFHKSKEGILRVDDKAVTTTVHWRALSDHFPIGGRFSLGVGDRRVQKIFVEESDSDFREARNVMYVRDILQGLYGEPEKEEDQKKLTAFMKSLAEKWPERKQTCGEESSMEATSSVERPEGEDSPYRAVFEAHRDALARVLLELKLESLAEMVVALNVSSEKVFDVLRAIVEEYARLGYQPAKSLQSGGIWRLDPDGAQPPTTSDSLSNESTTNESAQTPTNNAEEIVVEQSTSEPVNEGKTEIQSVQIDQESVQTQSESFYYQPFAPDLNDEVGWFVFDSMFTIPDYSGSYNMDLSSDYPRYIAFDTDPTDPLVDGDPMVQGTDMSADTMEEEVNQFIEQL